MAKRANGADRGADLQQSVEQFLYRQADLLDRKQWQEWIDLFTDDGVYWMPPEPSYTTWDGTPAIFAEDKNLMHVRMGRVLHPDAWSQRPLWGTNHVVSNVIVEKASPGGDVIVRSRFPTRRVNEIRDPSPSGASSRRLARTTASCHSAKRDGSGVPRP